MSNCSQSNMKWSATAGLGIKPTVSQLRVQHLNHRRVSFSLHPPNPITRLRLSWGYCGRHLAKYWTQNHGQQASSLSRRLHVHLQWLSKGSKTTTRQRPLLHLTKKSRVNEEITKQNKSKALEDRNPKLFLFFHLLFSWESSFKSKTNERKI